MANPKSLSKYKVAIENPVGLEWLIAYSEKDLEGVVAQVSTAEFVKIRTSLDGRGHRAVRANRIVQILLVS